ncbi:MAG: Fpg/Nei family DNA glycosylase, partial [Pseudomonadota bacterium]
MPELPEVETARRTLAPHVVGRRIEGVDVRRPQVVRSHTPRAAGRILTGRTCAAISRRGKALVFDLGPTWTMTFHFSLWGTILALDHPIDDAATAVVMTLGDGNGRGRVIEFRDLQLSNLNLFPTTALADVEYLASLGPDPLDRSVTALKFRRLLDGRGALRNLLTDQTRMAGIGNLWALEILFAAGLRPDRKTATLRDDEWHRLYRATRSVLQRGIRAGGEPEFIDADGRKGRFRLAVYGRGGQPCRRCGRPIMSGKVGGRPSLY